MRSFASLLAILALASCDETPLPGAPGGGGGSGGDGGTNECVVGSPPESCYADPRIEGELMYCSRGIRSCEGGVWGPCEEVESFTMPAPAVPSALITGPDVCNPCEPACNLSQTYPDDTDLNPDNSDLVDYDPVTGGVIPTLSPPASVVDTDGDEVPDDFDAFPTDPTRDGYTENGEIFHVLYYGGPAETDDIGDASGGVLSGVRRADVYFLMDGTISMGGEIANLSAALTANDYIYDPTACGLPGFAPPTWDGEYFDNATLTDPPKFTTTGETRIDYDWGHHAPVDPATNEVITLSSNYYSVRWTATVDAGATSADYVFRMSTNDGMRVYVDGALVGDEWRDQTVSNFEHAYTFSPGVHTVVVEYYEGSGDSVAKFFMSAVAPDEYKGLVGSIRCSIGDAYFGIGYFDDVPVSPYGQTPSTGCGTYTDSPYVHVLDMVPGLTTADLATIQSSADTLQARCGYDTPESGAVAIQSILTAGELGPSGTPYTAARDTSTCAIAGSFGYPCFRSGTVPIIVLFTDAEMHNGPYPYRDYSGLTGIPSYSAVTSAISSRGAKVIGIHSGYPLDWSCWGNSCIGYTCDSCYTEDHTTTTTHTHCTTTCVPGTESCYTHDHCNYDQVGTPIECWPVTHCSTPSVCTSTDCYTEDHTSTYTETHCSSCYCAGGYSPYYCSELSDTQSESQYSVQQLESLASTSGATDPDTGQPLVYQINRDGTGIGAAVAGAIGALAEAATMDITVVANDDPATTAVDETGFLVAVATNPDSSDPATDPYLNCTNVHADWYQACTPGTAVGFTLTFENNIVAPTALTQVFTFTVDMVGDGIYILDSIPVTIVVPAGVPGYPPGGGTVWQDYDTTASCTGELRPDWQDLAWTAIDIPPDTSIIFELQTADTLADLSSAPIVSVTTPPATSPVDVATELTSGGQPNNLNFLRVTARLQPSPDLLSAPTLDGFDLTYECVPVL